MKTRMTTCAWGAAAALVAATLAGTCLAGRAADAPAPLPLKTVADIPLDGRPTRFDYQSYDPVRHLLFIAHLGDSAVVVFDTRAQKVVATISDISKVHGVLAVPELGRVYATATGARQVVAIDEATLKVVGASPAGQYPDGLAYVPALHKLYVSDETGDAVVVIDAAANRQVGRIAIGGEVGNTQYDPVSGHVFANDQSDNDLVEIDPATDQAVWRHGLAGAQGNHGLLIEPTLRLAFIACEGNARLLVVDMRSMQVVAADSVGAVPDVLAYDPGLGLLYVASESGVVSVFKVDGPHLRKLGEGRLAAHAHTVAVAPETHRVYLPIEQTDGRPELRVMQPTVEHLLR